MGLNDAGVPGRNLPAGEDHVMRRLADLERAYRELVASTAVRPGSLGNDALTSPVVPQAISGEVDNFGLTVAGAAIIALPFTIPAGVTKACFLVTFELLVRNSRAVADQEGATTEIDFGGTPSMAYLGNILRTVAAGQWPNEPDIVSDAYTATGLTPGGTLTVQVYANSLGANWAASSGNYVKLRGFILWFR